MKAKLFLTVVALMAMIAVSNAQKGYGYCQNQGQGQGYNQGSGKGYFCQNIPGLSDEQKSKIEALRMAHWKTKLTTQNIIGEKKARLLTLQSAESADINAINSTIDEITTLQNTLWKSNSAHQLEIRKLLNDEQKVYFDTHQSNKGKGRGYRNRGRGNCRCN